MFTGAKGRAIALKVKRSQAGAPEPTKYLGHGLCDNVSRTLNVATATDSADQVYEAVLGLLLALAIPPEELRGLGIQAGVAGLRVPWGLMGRWAGWMGARRSCGA